MKASVCLGDNTIDRYLVPASVHLVGGNCANVAVHPRKSGVRSAYIGPVGDDKAGAHVAGAWACTFLGAFPQRVAHCSDEGAARQEAKSL